MSVVRNLLTEQDECHDLAIQKLLARLQKLVSIENSEPTSDSERALCTRCQERSFPWQTGSLKWREVEEGAHNLKCPICQFLLDWLPIHRLSSVKREPERPDAVRAVLKIGRLDSYMDEVMSVATRFEDRNTSSDCAFQMVAAWMTTCIKNHNNCAIDLPPLPTRILDVGSQNDPVEPRLHFGRREKAMYLTLSYRWKQNGAAMFQTTKANVKAYESSIPISSLPKVMQDAILITRRLGFRYLWIDALCIIQDSEEDWKAEAKRMASTYSNSTLTISAAADPVEGNDGIFRARSRLHTRPYNSKSPWPDGTSKYVFADRRFTNDGARPPSTLDKRAWILQEQLLSPRVLTYSNEELYWECLSINASETFPGGIPGFYDADFKMEDLRFFKDTVLGAGDRTPSSDRFYESWKKVVESYTEREMTKETDKIVALLGVANAASIMFNDEFLLGLWKKYIWRDLLWWVKKPETAKRSTEFGAPSWSWASIIGPISYALRGDDSTSSIRQCIEVIYAEAELDQALPLLRGRLIIRGRLVELNHQNQKRHSIPILPSWKEDMKEIDASEVKGLIIGFSRHYVYALGLIAKDGTGAVYNRAGRIEWTTSPVDFGWDEDRGMWSGGVELATVTVV